MRMMGTEKESVALGKYRLVSAQGVGPGGRYSKSLPYSLRNLRAYCYTGNGGHFLEDSAVVVHL